MDFMETETHYKKKEASDTSKASKRSEHKHEYREVLFYKYIESLTDGELIMDVRHGKQCRVCGKSKVIHEPTIRVENGWRSPTAQELLAEYHQVEMVEMPDTFI